MRREKATNIVTCAEAASDFAGLGAILFQGSFQIDISRRSTALLGLKPSQHLLDPGTNCHHKQHVSSCIKNGQGERQNRMKVFTMVCIISGSRNRHGASGSSIGVTTEKKTAISKWVCEPVIVKILH